MMAERPKILVTQKVPDPAYPLLEAIGDVEANMEEGVIWPYEELLRRGPGHDYIYSLLTDNIDARFLEAGAASTPRLKMVANMAVGFNNIDVDAATRLGIAVSNTPGVLSDTTADLAFALLMATARRIPEAERFLRAGKYKGWGPLLFCGAEVQVSTLGLIGGGRIGKIVRAVEPELLTMENVVLLPHIASASLGTRTLMATMASDNIVAHFHGQRPPNIVNPEVLG